MKKLIVPLIILVVLLSGCSELPEEGRFEILLEDGNIYSQDDPLIGLTFHLPSEINTKYGVTIIFEVFLPDDSSEGVYTQSFFPPLETEDLFIDSYAITLYYPGRWYIDYEIYEGIGEDKILALSGRGSLFVESDDVSLAEFEVLEFIVPEEVNRTESIYVSFTIQNVGMEPGTVIMSLFNNKLSEELTIYNFGYEWWGDEYYLEDDEEYSKTIYIPLIESDLDVTLRYNENEISKEVAIKGDEPIIEDIPIGNIVGFVFLGIIVAIVLFTRRW